MTISDLLSYLNHPMDNIIDLYKYKIPIILVCGEVDTVVPYTENVAVLKRLYEENNGIIQTILKPNCNHHPHGLEDPTPIVNFIQRYST